MRRVPQLPLPSDPFVPGTGQTRPPETNYASLPPAQVCRHGADLFDHGAFWEAHVAWEHLWITATGAERDALQGLIQGAALQLKSGPRFAAAAARLHHRALHHLDQALDAGLSELHTLDLRHWRQRIAGTHPD